MASHRPDSPEWITLETDERVWLVASPSNNILLASLVLGFALLIVMSVGVSFLTSLATGRVVSFATLIFIVALLLGAYGIVRTRAYLLTSDRAVVGVGLTEKQTSSVSLDAIDEVQIRQSTWQRLLDIGTVQLVTMDGTTVEFALVENPVEIGHEVRRLTGAVLGGQTAA